MNILMLIRTLDYSGAFKMFIWLAESLTKVGHSVTICTWINYENIELASNINKIKLNLSKNHFFSILRSFNNVVKEQNADICISFLLDANVYNTIACLGTRTKSIICERNDPFKPKYYKLMFWKPIFRYADGAVYQLPKVAEYYSNIKKNTAVIPNPVFSNHNDVISPFIERPEVIVSIGRLDIFQKRQDILIRSFALFLTKCPSYILKIYGDGTDEQKLKDLVSLYKIQDKVEFMGVTNDVTAALLKSKMFVLTSDFEGIPNALIEAMSIGLPCISTDCRPGGAQALINNGENGLLVPCGDVKAISDAMFNIASNGAYATELGLQAQKITDKFKEDVIIEQWNRYLCSIV